jgi:hypothetical protein
MGSIANQTTRGYPASFFFIVIVITFEISCTGC